jgi:Mn2+/Fe2+ NRAMP family transporter
MGEHVNNKFQNVVGWAGTLILVGLTAVLLVTQAIYIWKK